MHRVVLEEKERNVPNGRRWFSRVRKGSGVKWRRQDSNGTRGSNELFPGGREEGRERGEKEER